MKTIGDPEHFHDYSDDIDRTFQREYEVICKLSKENNYCFVIGDTNRSLEAGEYAK